MLSGSNVRGSDGDLGGIQMVARAHHARLLQHLLRKPVTKCQCASGFAYQPRSGDEELKRQAPPITHERAR
jgi:hypothetical protein